MIVAIPNNEKLVNQHFGRSTSFIIAEVKEEKFKIIEEVSTIKLLHQHDSLANMLLGRKVEVVIVGGIGVSATSALIDKGIQIIKGAEGEYEKVLEEYAKGNLVSRNTSCEHDGGHHHHHH